MQRRMNSCVEDNFKEDLLQWTLSKAGQSGQEEWEEVWIVPLHHGCQADVLCFYTLNQPLMKINEQH